MRLAQRRTKERGATVPEYAMMVGLVAVALMGSISFLQDRSADELDGEDQRVGVIEDEAAYAAPIGPGGPPVADPPPPAGSTLAAPTFAPTQGATNASGNKWNAFVTITILDDGGEAVSGVAVEFRWSAGTSPLGSCTTNGEGKCLVSQTVNDVNPSVTVEVTEMTKTGWTPPLLPATSGAFGCNPPLNASCN